jgi:signal transduction histidine kinase
MRSIQFRLFLAFLLVALVSVAIVGISANRIASSRFGHFVSESVMMDSGGMMGRMGMGMRRVLERDFITSVNRYLAISALITVLLAAVVSYVLSQRMTTPIRHVTRGAHEMAAGNLAHRVAVSSRDEIGELAESFNRMAASLEDAETIRRNMIADVAHELRTPLASIRGYLEAIQDGVIAPTKENLASIHEDTVLLARLVDDLRDLSQAEAGRLNLHRAPADVGGIVKKQLIAAQPLVAKKGITIGSSIPDVLQEVIIDKDRTGQVLRNLLSNAIAFSPEGGSIDVVVEKKPGFLEISVSDTGPGIAPQDLPFVFERFYRADKSRARASGGAGLGLTIAKYLVEAQGGKIWAESEAGRGAKLVFTIPLESAKP